MSAPTSPVNTNPSEQPPPPKAPPGGSIPVGTEALKQNGEIRAENNGNPETNEVKSVTKPNTDTGLEVNSDIKPNEEGKSVLKESNESNSDIKLSEIKSGAEVQSQVKPIEEKKLESNANIVAGGEVQLATPEVKLSENPVPEPQGIEGKGDKPEANIKAIEPVCGSAETLEPVKTNENTANEVLVNSSVARSEEQEVPNSENNPNLIDSKKDLEVEKGDPVKTDKNTNNESVPENKEKIIEASPTEELKTPNDGTKTEPQKTSNGAPENSPENKDDDECVNIDELTEHVMNIINDGIASEPSTKDDLLQKNVELQQFIVKLIHLLKEKTDLCINLDRQNSALISQAKSLKDVISITKDLLGIRNMEIEHLHADLDSMQETIKSERNRHNTAIQHLNEAMGLNEKLKAEYLTQMDLFQKLKDKYTEKVVVLTRENIRLNALMQENGIDTSATPTSIEAPETPASNIDPNQPESVDK